MALGTLGLATDWLHGPAEAREDGEASDVGEGEAESPRGQLEVAEATEERSRDGGFREPHGVHWYEREGEPFLPLELHEDASWGEMWPGG